MNLIIEKLKREDLKEAISIYDDNYNLKSNYDKLLNVYDEIYNNTAYHNIVAKLDGKIVGLATIIINYDIVEELKPFLTVWNFGVRKEYRRKGFATEIWRELCSQLLAEGKEVFSFYYTDESRALHKRIGFEEICQWAKIVVC